MVRRDWLVLEMLNRIAEKAREREIFRHDGYECTGGAPVSCVLYRKIERFVKGSHASMIGAVGSVIPSKSKWKAVVQLIKTKTE